MVTASDIIVKLIKDAGYKNIESFAKKNNIITSSLEVAIKRNSWTKPMIKKVSDALNKDLSNFINASVGGGRKGVKYSNE